jgi:simple sugar transport system permease protein
MNLWEILGDIFTIHLVLATLRLATPIALIALGETFSERVGIINVGVEGTAVLGGLVSALVAYATGSPWIALVASVLAGGLAGGLHALWCIRFRANHVVSGIGINILVAGLALFITSSVWGWRGTSTYSDTLNSWVIVGAMFAIVFLSQIFIFRTRWGLRLRVVGEKPEAADTAGINVHRTRYVYTIVNGMLCGLAGAFLFNNVGRFTTGMVGGRGFIGIAAMVIGNYSPVGALGAALLFGFIDALQMRLQTYIPSQFSIMLPYLITVLVLAFLIRRAQVPAALGKHYVKQ